MPTPEDQTATDNPANMIENPAYVGAPDLSCPSLPSGTSGGLSILPSEAALPISPPDEDPTLSSVTSAEGPYVALLAEGLDSPLPSVVSPSGFSGYEVGSLGDTEGAPNAAPLESTALAGQDPHSGKFLPGNTLHRNSRLAVRTARLRTALIRAFDAGDIAEMAEAMKRKAASGDVAACKLCWEYLYGPPQALDLMQQVATLEGMVLRRVASNG